MCIVLLIILYDYVYLNTSNIMSVWLSVCLCYS